MYRRPKFLEVLLEIRREMALEADYDVDLFAEMTRSGKGSAKARRFDVDSSVVPSPVDDQQNSPVKRTRRA